MIHLSGVIQNAFHETPKRAKRMGKWGASTGGPRSSPSACLGPGLAFWAIQYRAYLGVFLFYDLPAGFIGCTGFLYIFPEVELRVLPILIHTHLYSFISTRCMQVFGRFASEHFRFLVPVGECPLGGSILVPLSQFLKFMKQIQDMFHSSSQD